MDQRYAVSPTDVLGIVDFTNQTWREYSLNQIILLRNFYKYAFDALSGDGFYLKEQLLVGIDYLEKLAKHHKTMVCVDDFIEQANRVMSVKNWAEKQRDYNKMLCDYNEYMPLLNSYDVDFICSFIFSLNNSLQVYFKSNFDTMSEYPNTDLFTNQELKNIQQYAPAINRDIFAKSDDAILKMNLLNKQLKHNAKISFFLAISNTFTDFLFQLEKDLAIHNVKIDTDVWQIDNMQQIIRNFREFEFLLYKFYDIVEKEFDGPSMQDLRLEIKKAKDAAKIFRECNKKLNGMIVGIGMAKDLNIDIADNPTLYEGFYKMQLRDLCNLLKESEDVDLRPIKECIFNSTMQILKAMNEDKIFPKEISRIDELMRDSYIKGQAIRDYVTQTMDLMHKSIYFCEVQMKREVGRVVVEFYKRCVEREEGLVEHYDDRNYLLGGDDISISTSSRAKEKRL